MMVFLGCYTDDAHPNGLKILSLDAVTGEMSVVADMRLSNALYQALSPDGSILYSCTGDGLASFRRQPAESWAWEKVDEVKIGNCVCHVAVMPDDRRVVFADYMGGFAGSVAVADGRFGEVTRHQHAGAGPNLPRQATAHCHHALPLPGGAGYVVCDLGLDELVEYPSGRVFKTAPAGAGPRHILFHPNGRLAFLVSELGNLVSSLTWNASDGFRLIDTLPTLEDASLPVGSVTGTTNTDLAAAVRFTPDGKCVVVSNRGENSLVVYGFDEATGRLSFKARTRLPGSWPRDFIFATETLALVAMERSGEAHALRYEASTGCFAVVSTLSGLFRPVSLTRVADRRLPAADLSRETYAGIPDWEGSGSKGERRVRAY